MAGSSRAVYRPRPPPNDPKELREYLQRELDDISAALPQGLDLIENAVEPDKVFDGMLRLFANDDDTYTLAIRMGGAWWAAQVTAYTPPT